MPLWRLCISPKLQVYLDDIFGYNIHLEFQHVDPYILLKFRYHIIKTIRLVDKVMSESLYFIGGHFEFKMAV